MRHGMKKRRRQTTKAKDPGEIARRGTFWDDHRRRGTFPLPLSDCPLSATPSVLESLRRRHRLPYHPFLHRRTRQRRRSGKELDASVRLVEEPPTEGYNNGYYNLKLTQLINVVEMSFGRGGCFHLHCCFGQNGSVSAYN